MKLIIADKNYPSWSMRAWVLLTHFGLAFDEILIELDEPGTRAAILAHSPSGRVPCLVTDDGLTVWDTLAIAETLAERHPLWPRGPENAAARAHARSISAEMHAGFGALREQMPMNIRASMPARGLGATPGALADIARIDALWRACLAARGGPFLFGEFGIADAMYAPIVMRFNTYQPSLSAQSADYAARITALPAVAAWIDAARRETHIVPSDELMGDAPGDKSSDKPGDKLSGKLGSKLNGKSGDKLSSKPDGKLSDKLGRKLSGKPGDKLNDKPGGKLSGEPGDKLSSKPGGKLSGKPGGRLSSKSDDKLNGRPGDKLSDKPGNKLSSKPGDKPDNT